MTYNRDSLPLHSQHRSCWKISIFIKFGEKFHIHFDFSIYLLLLCQYYYRKIFDLVELYWGPVGSYRWCGFIPPSSSTDGEALYHPPPVQMVRLYTTLLQYRWCGFIPPSSSTDGAALYHPPPVK